MKRICQYNYNDSFYDYCFYELKGDILKTEINLPSEVRTDDDKTWVEEEKLYRVRIVEMQETDISEYDRAFVKILANSKELTFESSEWEENNHLPDFFDLKTEIICRNIPITGSDRDFWYIVEKKSKELNNIKNDAVFINFILMQEEFFLDPFKFYDVDSIYGKKEQLEKRLSSPYGNKSKRRKYAIKLKEFVSVLEKFSMIISDEYEIEQEIMLEVTWKVLKEVAIRYYADIWNSIYNQKGIIYHNEKNLARVVSKALNVGGLTNKDDVKYFQFIYYCMNLNLVNSHNFYNAFVKTISVIESCRKEYAMELLRSKVMQPVKGVPQYTIDDVDMMNGKEFEEFVYELYLRMGYSVEITKQSGDQGIDVIAEKKGMRIGIQAKCYSGTVGNSAVQEAVAGKTFYKCNKVLVITNNYFTPSAVELANTNNVILINRDILKDKIKDYM